MAVYLRPAQRKAAEAAAKADEWLSDLDRALQEAKSWLKVCGGGELSALLKKTVEQMSFAKRSGVPDLLPDVYFPLVESKDLAAPIHDKTSKSHKLVGYVDVEVRMNTVTSIEFRSGIPHWLGVPKNETHEARDRRRASFRVDDFNAFDAEPASWCAERAKRYLWIDVRPELVPIGQVMRELKVLQSYAPTRYSYYGEFTQIVVVYRDEDAVAAEMLRNENFIPVSEQVLCKL